jgi:hypothetical protein
VQDEEIARKEKRCLQIRKNSLLGHSDLFDGGNPELRRDGGCSRRD